MLDVKAAAEAAGVSRKAILKRIRANKKRGEPDLLKATLRGGNYKITETQAKEFWRLVSNGWTTEKACQLTGISRSNGDNIRAGKSWTHITGKKVDDKPSKTLKASIIELIERGLNRKKITELTGASEVYVNDIFRYCGIGTDDKIDN